MTTTPEYSLLSLETELENDSSGQCKNRLLDMFNQEAVKIKFAMDKGVAPAEFERLQKLLTALQAGSDVIEKLWRRYHHA